VLTNGLEEDSYSKITAKFGYVPGVVSISSANVVSITEYLNTVEQSGIVVFGNTLASYSTIRCNSLIGD
jgi:hypothetical protein